MKSDFACYTMLYLYEVYDVDNMCMLANCILL